MLSLLLLLISGGRVQSNGSLNFRHRESKKVASRVDVVSVGGESCRIKVASCKFPDQASGGKHILSPLRQFGHTTMTLVEGEELQRLWALVSELSSQLSSNRELCQSLQAQADDLKGQALHTGTGYTLRRFNLDISKEKFDSELERLNSQLVMENQGLTHENKQINLLLREYENTLETVMSKFRSFSVSWVGGSS